MSNTTEWSRVHGMVSSKALVFKSLQSQGKLKRYCLVMVEHGPLKKQHNKYPVWLD